MNSYSKNQSYPQNKSVSQNLLARIKVFKPVLFILPALLGYLIFLVIPIIETIRFSFFEWNGVSPTMDFVWFGNYLQVFQDPIFWRSLLHNVLWILFTIAVPVSLGLILASLIMAKGIKGRVIFRVTYFMPVIVSLVAVGIIWAWMYHPNYGLFNEVLSGIGLGSLTADWLGNSSTVLMSLIVAGSWTYYGFCLVIFLAAMQGIDKSYYEVAKIEGANPLQTFLFVTIPLLKNTITLLVMFSLFNSFKVFDLVYLMTKGGPYHSSEVVATYMFTETFRVNNVGYGSAISIVLAGIVLVTSVTYMWLSERKS